MFFYSAGLPKLSRVISVGTVIQCDKVRRFSVLFLFTNCSGSDPCTNCIRMLSIQIFWKKWSIKVKRNNLTLNIYPHQIGLNGEKKQGNKYYDMAPLSMYHTITKFRLIKVGGTCDFVMVPVPGG